MANNTETKEREMLGPFRLSARWMEDHLDCCSGPDYWGEAGNPEGKFNKRVWTGHLNMEQIREIVSRADYYMTFFGTWDYPDNRSICDAAKRTLEALTRQGVDLAEVRRM
jgi:hypothetical protein